MFRLSLYDLNFFMVKNASARVPHFLAIEKTLTKSNRKCYAKMWVDFFWAFMLFFFWAVFHHVGKPLMKSCPWAREALYCCFHITFFWGSLSEDQSWAVSEATLRFLCLVTLSAWQLFFLLSGLLASWGASHCSLHVDVSPCIMTFSFWLLSYLTHPVSLPKGYNGTGVACQGSEGITSPSYHPWALCTLPRAMGPMLYPRALSVNCSGAGLQLPTALALVPA